MGFFNGLLDTVVNVANEIKETVQNMNEKTREYYEKYKRLRPQKIINFPAASCGVLALASLSLFAAELRGIKPKEIKRNG